MRSWGQSVITGAIVFGLLLVGPRPGPAFSGLGEQPTSRQLAGSQRPAPRPLIVGYHVEQTFDAWTTFLTEQRRLNWIITTNYSLVDLQGSLQGAPNPAVVDVAHRSGAKVHFRVANFTGGDFRREVAHAILTQPAPRARAIASILRVLDVYHYDGVNIDLENVSPKDRMALTDFTARLSRELRPRRKTLSIAVPGTVRDQPDDDWSGAFDLRALGRISDTVIVMAYDEHWSTSAPGPIAALPWVEAVVRYTTGQIGREKLLLGVAFYGYDWPVRGFGEGVSMREAVSRATLAKTPILWDPQGQVPYFKVAGRTVYFENAQSIERKLTLATRQKLAGVAAWRLGHELPEVWDVLAIYQTNPQELLTRKLTRRPLATAKAKALIPEIQGVPLGGK